MYISSTLMDRLFWPKCIFKYFIDSHASSTRNKNTALDMCLFKITCCLWYFQKSNSANLFSLTGNKNSFRIHISSTDFMLSDIFKYVNFPNVIKSHPARGLGIFGRNLGFRATQSRSEDLQLRQNSSLSENDNEHQ